MRQNPRTGPDDDIRARGDEYGNVLEAYCNRDSCWLEPGHDGECKPGGCSRAEGTCAVCGRSRPCPTEQAVLKWIGGEE